MEFSPDIIHDPSRKATFPGYSYFIESEKTHDAFTNFQEPSYWQPGFSLHPNVNAVNKKKRKNFVFIRDIFNS
jgi:hypothetical protein